METERSIEMAERPPRDAEVRPEGRAILETAVRLARTKWLKPLLPQRLRSAVRRLLPATEYQRESNRLWAEDLYGGPVPLCSDYPPRRDHRVAIVRDQMWSFVHNVRACRDLGVPFEVVDLTGDDWLDRARGAGTKSFLVWPSIHRSVWKQIYDERLRVLAEADGVELVPRLDEIWLQDSKRRGAYWLAAHGVPAPRTWVFYEKREALRFLAGRKLPLVFKTDAGAASHGVFVLRSVRPARRLVSEAFGRGVRTKAGDAGDRQFGNVLFQEYIGHSHEWRVVRVGEHFLCRKKNRAGDFASGSGSIGWAFPPPGLLDFVRDVTDRGGFQNMSVDVFEAPSGDDRGPFLVNELQCVVGAIEEEQNVNEATGRWSRGPEGTWLFERGFFYQNGCANLRLEAYLSRKR